MSQPLDALAYGNEIRLAQAAYRREIAALDKGTGCERVAEMLRNPPHHLANIRAGRVVRFINRVGITEADKMLRNAGINPQRKLGPLSDFSPAQQLSDIQRHRLAAVLLDTAARYTFKGRFREEVAA